MASSGDTYSTDATPGSASTSATSWSMAAGSRLSTSRAVTPTLLSM